VAKSADAKDLKSFFPQGECGFKSHPGHQFHDDEIGKISPIQCNHFQRRTTVILVHRTKQNLAAAGVLQNIVQASVTTIEICSVLIVSNPIPAAIFRAVLRTSAVRLESSTGIRIDSAIPYFHLTMETRVPSPSFDDIAPLNPICW
jgi:hypothetical protein